MLSTDMFSGVKMVKNAFVPGAPPGPRWGSLQRSPKPPSWTMREGKRKGLAEG